MDERLQLAARCESLEWKDNAKSSLIYDVSRIGWIKIAMLIKYIGVDWQTLFAENQMFLLV